MIEVVHVHDPDDPELSAQGKRITAMAMAVAKLLDDMSREQGFNDIDEAIMACTSVLAFLIGGLPSEELRELRFVETGIKLRVGIDEQIAVGSVAKVVMAHGTKQ